MQTVWIWFKRHDSIAEIWSAVNVCLWQNIFRLWNGLQIEEAKSGGKFAVWQSMKMWFTKCERQSVEERMICGCWLRGMECIPTTSNHTEPTVKPSVLECCCHQPFEFIKPIRSPDRHMSSHGLTGKLAEPLSDCRGEQTDRAPLGRLRVNSIDFSALSVLAVCIRRLFAAAVLPNRLGRLIGRAVGERRRRSVGLESTQTKNLSCLKRSCWWKCP